MYLQRRDIENNLYERLQKQSLEMFQRLSGNIWTDYNEHDPGITLSDVLNYALFELKYRTGFEFKEYLGNPVNGELCYEDVGLLPGSEVFDSPVVTPHDYKLLIEKHLKEKIKECEVSLSENRCYVIKVEVTEGTNPETVRESVMKLYHRHRNLGENLEEVTVKNKIDSKNNKYSYAGHDLVYQQEEEQTTVSQRVWAKEYRSVQYDLPNCYGIGESGLPTGASEERRIAALQLKAYLLIFDYMLSGTEQQIRNIHRLQELSGEIPAGFSCNINIKELEALLDKDKSEKTEVFNTEETEQKKSAYFNFLDGIYGEDTQIFFPNLLLAEANRYRAKLIRQLPYLNTRRFSSFDLTDEHLSSLPAIKQLLSEVLEHSQKQETSLINPERKFSDHNIKLIDNKTFYQKVHKTVNVAFFAEGENVKDEQRFQKIPRISLRKDDEQTLCATVKRYLKVFEYDMPEELLEHGRNPENYRIRQYELSDHITKGYNLLYRCPGKNYWANLAGFSNKEKLIETANSLWRFLKKVYHATVSFYVVEHILLLDDITDTESRTGKFHRLSLIIPHWAKSFYRENEGFSYQRLVEDRLPAHLDVRFYEFEEERIYRFEKLYFQWRKAWTEEYMKTDRPKVRALSAGIRSML
ncbi:hypothetical protein EZS27_005569 [termite gut metagenome]|uniref:Uncharacterized protein n=1 Tax=termite gut metagenome TaxID=433724 RepID=A0A5J4SPB5_9ZZZZ